MNSTTWTIKRILEWSAEYFNKQSIDTSRLDAEVLLAHTLQTDRLSLYLEIDKPLSQKELAAYKELIKRRASREPVAYITGKKEFWSLNFTVNRHVLIPRPGTEILVHTVIEKLKKTAHNQATRILDIGTGSGNIAISLAKECPESQINAIDLSSHAISTAIENAATHHVQERINFLCGDLFEPLKNGEQFDVIVSNPPYIPSQKIEPLAPEISYEPKGALDGKEDGLAIITAIIENAHRFLKRNGFLAIEIGSTQAADVLSTSQKWYSNAEISIVKDFSKNDRVALITNMI